MKTRFLFLLTIISLKCFSQSLKQNIADKHYKALAFEKAAPLYSELAMKKNSTTEIIRKAATSYRFLNTPKEAELMYSKLTQKSDATKDDIYNYAQVLRLNGKYKEADEQMKRIHLVDQNNTVAKRYTNVNYDYISKIKSDSLKFEIKNLTELNSIESEFSPVFYNKRNELAYSSNRENHGANNKEFAWDNTNFLDIYKTKIDTAKQIASKPEKFDKSLKSSFHDGPITFSPDGKSMILTRSNYYDDKLQKSTSNIVNIQMYYATKTNDNWGDLIPFPYNNKDYNFGQACFAPDGKTVYFVSDMPGSFGNTDIWETSFDGKSFTQPQNLGQEINTEGREMFPFIDDENLLLYASDGFLGLGGLDIHMASLNGIPSYIGNVGYPLNTNADDFGLIYDSKTLKGYFTSNRPGGKGKDDIYAVKFKESLKPKISIKGFITDKSNGKGLSNANVYLVNKSGQIFDSVLANKNGEYQFLKSDVSNIEYIISVNQNFKTGITDIDELGKKPLNIELSPMYTLKGTITDVKTKKNIEGVKATIMNDKIRKTIFTNNSGEITDSISKSYGEEITIAIKLEKEGYITINHIANITLGTDRVIDVSKYMKTEMQPLEKNIDLAKVGDLKPIYFDYGKFDIRADAAIELDKIVAIMKENASMIIELGSHTDCRSSKTYNMKLSDKRAKASVGYIISKGIQKSRIYGKGYGESKLLNKCECEDPRLSLCSEEEHQKNRRTEFLIIKY